MIAFGMKTTLVHFQDKYYNYNGVVKENGGIENKDNNGLAIGAFEVAFFIDIGATYIYEMCKEIIKTFKYMGMLCDDGLTIFQGQSSIKQTISWFCDFQLQVDEVVGSIFFQFTVELWKMPGAIKAPTMEGEIDVIWQMNG
eukprot:4200966-Ditylum_brightwellii.AAC.1